MDKTADKCHFNNTLPLNNIFTMVKDEFKNDESRSKVWKEEQDDCLDDTLPIYATFADKVSVSNDKLNRNTRRNIESDLSSPGRSNTKLNNIRTANSIKEEYEDDSYLDHKMFVCELTTVANSTCHIKTELSSSEQIGTNAQIKEECDINLESTNQEQFSEMVQCQFCKIDLVGNEYLEYHMQYCCQMDNKEDLIPPLNVEIIEIPGTVSLLNKRKKQKRGIYKCSQCKYKTTYKSDLKNHTNEHFQVKVFICGICHKRYTRKDALNFHINNFHADERRKIYECSLCDYKTYIKIYLQSHMNTKHCKTKKYNCSKCDYKTAYRVSLKRHADTHVTEKHLKCSMCQYATNSKYRLKLHHHTHEMVKRYKCIKCDYETHHKYRLTDHFFNNHGERKRFECLHCEYKTNFNSNLKKHVLTMHRAGEVEKIKCSQCDYASHNKHRLKEHFESRHVALKQFTCSECQYATNNKSNLKKHVTVKHSESSKYKCPRCDYETGYKCSLKNHLRYHEDGKRLQCPECDFKTKYDGSLREHVNVIHRAIKKFKCSLCQYETAYKTSFKNHVYSHGEMERFQCTECDFETNYNTYLKAHVKRKHSNVEINQT